MIQIIAGTFGYYNGKRVVPIKHEDGPQTFDPELEARLVQEGIAQYIDQENNDTTNPHEYRKLEELKEIAKSLGVDASAMRKKSDIIRAIEAAQRNQENQEQPPSPDVGELI